MPTDIQIRRHAYYRKIEAMIQRGEIEEGVPVQVTATHEPHCPILRPDFGDCTCDAVITCRRADEEGAPL